MSELEDQISRILADPREMERISGLARSLMGGGDGYFYFRTLRNKNYSRKELVPQYIYTSDSTVMYQLNFGQAGEKDK